MTDLGLILDKPMAPTIPRVIPRHREKSKPWAQLGVPAPHPNLQMRDTYTQTHIRINLKNYELRGFISGRELCQKIQNKIKHKQLWAGPEIPALLSNLGLQWRTIHNRWSNSFWQILQTSSLQLLEQATEDLSV